MVSAPLNTVYSVVGLVGLTVVLRVGGTGGDGSTRMELTVVAVALFVIGLVASTPGYL